MKKREADESEPLAEVNDAPAEAPPLAEYPKMLYIGARRQQVLVNNADEEAQWLAAEDESEKSAKKRGER